MAIDTPMVYVGCMATWLMPSCYQLVKDGGGPSARWHGKWRRR